MWLTYHFIKLKLYLASQSDLSKPLLNPKFFGSDKIEFENLRFSFWFLKTMQKFENFDKIDKHIEKFLEEKKLMPVNLLALLLKGNLLFVTFIFNPIFRI